MPPLAHGRDAARYGEGEGNKKPASWKGCFWRYPRGTARNTQARRWTLKFRRTERHANPCERIEGKIANDFPPEPKHDTRKKIAKAAGGRGKKGGLREYAAQVGKDAGDLSKYRNAARVVETLGMFQGFSVSTLLDKAAHLAAIHAQEAERKMGEMLRETERAKPPNPKPAKDRRLHDASDDHRPSADLSNSDALKDTPTLADLGISKRESAEAQTPAAP